MPRQKSRHVDDPVAVGRRLKDARRRANLSQRDLSFDGCSAAYISRIEKGDRIPSLQLLRELGRRLGVTADYLATGEEVDSRDRLLEAELALRLGDFEVAEALFADALDDLDSHRRGRALAGLGQLSLQRGDPATAIDRLTEAERLLGDAVLEYPAVLISLSSAYQVHGEAEKTLAVLERSLGLARRAEDRLTEQRFCVLLANALIDRGNFGRAEELLASVIAETDQARDPDALARVFWSQSRLHIARGAFDLASSYARRALGLLELTQNAHHAARAHHLLAYIELERNRPAEALELLRAGLPLIERGGEQIELALFRLEESRALLALGETEEARELALEVLGSLGVLSSVDSARAATLVAEVLAETGDLERAIDLYRDAVEEMSNSPFAVKACRRLAELLEQTGRKDEAFDMLKRAVSLQEGATNAV
jgi:tetratricopeptide (TPR) repeat protein